MLPHVVGQLNELCMSMNMQWHMGVSYISPLLWLFLAADNATTLMGDHMQSS